MASGIDPTEAVTELERHGVEMLGVGWTELSDGETSASQKEAQHVSYTEVTQRRGYDAAEQGGGVITYR